MKLSAEPKKRWAWSGAMLGGLALAALAFGVPDSGGCGGPVAPPATATATPSGPPAAVSGDDGSTLSGAVDGEATRRMAGSLKVLFVWDVADRAGGAFKLGEGTIASGAFSLVFPAAPPDAALADGVVGVAHLVAVASSSSIPDGPLDDTDALAQAALGASGAYAIIYKAGESARYGWLAAFPRGYSCAQGQPPEPGASLAGDAPLAGFAKVGCQSLRLSLGAIDAAPFTNWALPSPPPRAALTAAR